MSDPTQLGSFDDGAETTQFRTASQPLRARAPLAGEWVHSLRVVEGAGTGLRLRVGPDALQIGRRDGNDLLLPDAEVSSRHCSVRALAGDPELLIVDLGSTNGSFVDGQRVEGTARLRDRGLLQLGRHVLMHEFLPLADMRRAEQADRELERARHYVMSLLPPPLTEGPVRSEWLFRPSAMLGGDAFGMVAVDARRIAGYVIDVSGHGTGVAMHSVSVMNVLRSKALPDTDFADPAQVLTRLNAMFQMDAHDGLCFTLWYGVYDLETREMAYASGGHHPAYLRAPGGGALQPLATRQMVLGALPDVSYRAERCTVPPGARLYVFSDGLFEYTGRDGRPRSLQDLLPLIEASSPTPGEAERLYRAARQQAADGPLEDDCSIVIVTFV